MAGAAYTIACCPAGFNPQKGWRMRRKLFSRENLFALGLCLIVILLVIATTDTAPQWIYQGF